MSQWNIQSLFFFLFLEPALSTAKHGCTIYGCQWTNVWLSFSDVGRDNEDSFWSIWSRGWFHGSFLGWILWEGRFASKLFKVKHTPGETSIVNRGGACYQSNACNNINGSREHTENQNFICLVSAPIYCRWRYKRQWLRVKANGKFLDLFISDLH